MSGLKPIAASAVILTSILLLSCEGETKKLVDGYRLERFAENGKFYLITSRSESGGGVFDGTIEKIGWNQDWILASVTRLYNGDPNGWYALQVKTKQVTGPFSEAEIKANPAFSGILPISCADVMAGKSGR